jgi:nitrate reductase NapE component
VPKGEMSCYHDDAEERRKGESMGMAFIALCAIAIVALCVVGGYLLYEPVVFLLRQFN